MGRSVSYPSYATVVTFADNSGESCTDCEGQGTVECGQCEGSGETDAMGETEECPVCDGSGTIMCEDCDGAGWIEPQADSDDLIDAFRQHLKTLFPSVEEVEDWIDREDHVLAENKLARFGMSEYCGLVAYWIVPKEYSGPKGQLYYSSDSYISAISNRWVRSVADKFVAAFGELTKVGSMSNGEGVYRRIDK
jgi:hypothetical protein